ncbi:hypothetical protein BKA63DRAFT_123552 [Paraphoma chrysanthemicola]|nr:hypothetical protein BKA63DRAFT_123552 [Paraphoma chrysanthemicola]
MAKHHAQTIDTDMRHEEEEEPTSDQDDQLAVWQPDFRVRAPTAETGGQATALTIVDPEDPRDALIDALKNELAAEKEYSQTIVNASILADATNFAENEQTALISRQLDAIGPGGINAWVSRIKEARYQRLIAEMSIFDERNSRLIQRAAQVEERTSQLNQREAQFDENVRAIEATFINNQMQVDTMNVHVGSMHNFQAGSMQHNVVSDYFAASPLQVPDQPPQAHQTSDRPLIGQEPSKAPSGKTWAGSVPGQPTYRTMCKHDKACALKRCKFAPSSPTMGWKTSTACLPSLASTAAVVPSMEACKLPWCGISAQAHGVFGLSGSRDRYQVLGIVLWSSSGFTFGGTYGI